MVSRTGWASLVILALFPGKLPSQSRPWLFDRPCARALAPRDFRVDTIRSAGLHLDSCEEERCAKLRMGGQVCQCIKGDSRIVAVDGIGPSTLQIARPRTIVDSFEVIEAQLDADGSPSIALAIADAFSNGMVVGYWTVYVLDPRGVKWSIDSLPVQDYSILGSWVVVRGENRCSLLQTAWVNGWEPVRGDGLYLEASWQTVEYSRFVRRADRPLLRRRYLYGFERERGDTTIQDAPLAWLRSPQAAPWLEPSHR